MSNLICKENFNWKKYVDRYKDLKSIDNLDNAWNHWCEEGKKQGRKFFTLAPYKNNKYYIITKEYIKQKNIKLKNTKNTKNIVVSSLDDDAVIEDFVSNIKHKLKKLNKNNKFVCQTVNQNIEDKIIKKTEINKKDINKQNNHNKSNIKNEDIEILEKDIKYTESKINNKKSIEECHIKNNNNKKSIEECHVKTNKNEWTVKTNKNERTDKTNKNEWTVKTNKNERTDKKNKDERTDKKNKDERTDKKNKDEWTDKTENSEIFFLDFDKNNDDSNESKIYLSKKNPLNVFSNSG